MQSQDEKSGVGFWKQLWSSIVATVILCVIVSGVYPLLIWAIAQGLFPDQANGSLLKRDGSYTSNAGDAVGSALLGQVFIQPGYFHPRPSAANNSAGSSFSPTAGYDPTSSGGTNFGPLSDELINGALNPPAPATQPTAAAAPTTAPAPTLAYDGVRLRTLHYAKDNGLSFQLYTVAPDGTRTAVPLKKYQDAQGDLNDVALVSDFPHPATDAADRTVLIAADFRSADGNSVAIPADAVTASGSGLDPHISPANALLQAQRVAAARKIPLARVNALIAQYTDGPDLGILGDPGVNVLRLNLALDNQFPMAAAAPAGPATEPAHR